MDKYIVGAVAFSMIFITGIAFALSDLQITNLEYSANTNRLVATIQNREDEAAGVLVYFYEEGRKIGEAIHDEKVPAHQSFSVYIDYVLAPGEHTLQAAADPLNTVEESNEANNERTVSLIISDNATKSVVPYTREELARQQTLASLKSLGFYIGLLVIVLAFLALFFTKIKHASLHRDVMPEIRTIREHHEEGRNKSIFSSIKLPKKGKNASGEIQKAEIVNKEGKSAANAKLQSLIRILHRKHPAEKIQEETREAALKPVAAEEGLLKIKDVAKQAAGTKVIFRARLKYQDKIGKDYAYFLNDDTEHIIGFSKSNIDKKEAVIEGFTQNILGDNAVVMIKKIE